MTTDTPPLKAPSAPFVERRFSTLTLRILAVNLVAPLMLIVGLFYLGEYRRNLIATEHSALRTHAEIFSVALGESAVSQAGPQLIPDMTVGIVRRLAFTAETRARIFDTDGSLVADSRQLLEPGGQIQREELPVQDPEMDATLLSIVFGLMDQAYMWLPGVEEYTPYQENIEQHASDYPEVMAAMAGDTWAARRTMPDGTLLLTVAMPVKRYKQTLGVLMLSKDSSAIESALYEVRLDILKVFGVALITTVLVSLYLAGTIARPIRRLAHAAEQVRKGHHRQHTIPDFKGRADEIGELAVALNDMTEALWTRMDAIESFAADVSHEIKNPLTSLKSAVETVTRVDDPAQQKKLMAIILDDVARLDRLITDISDASRLDAELSRAETAPVNVSGLLGTLTDIHAATADDSTSQVLLEADDALIADGLEDRLVQVFRNLIANAVSFSPPGGTVRIGAGREGTNIVVTVDDDGPGIPAGKEQCIFKRFYTERPDAEAFGKHSGLGLSISSQIIEAHDGQLTAETRRDSDGKAQGARFTVVLAAA